MKRLAHSVCSVLWLDQLGAELVGLVVLVPADLDAHGPRGEAFVEQRRCQPGSRLCRRASGPTPDKSARAAPGGDGSREHDASTPNYH